MRSAFERFLNWSNAEILPPSTETVLKLAAETALHGVARASSPASAGGVPPPLMRPTTGKDRIIRMDRMGESDHCCTGTLNL